MIWPLELVLAVQKAITRAWEVGPVTISGLFSYREKIVRPKDHQKHEIFG